MAEPESPKQLSSNVEEIVTVQAQLIEAIRCFGEFDDKSIRAKNDAYFEELRVAHVKQVEAELAMMGSDAESAPDDDEFEKKWHEKWLARKEKKAAAACEAAENEKRELAKGLAFRLFVLLGGGAYEGSDKESKEEIRASLVTTVPERSTPEMITEVSPSCVSSMDGTIAPNTIVVKSTKAQATQTIIDEVKDEGNSATAPPQTMAVNIDIADEKVKELEQRIVLHKNMVRAAFEIVPSSSTVVDTPFAESKEGMVVRKLKQRYIAERIISIPQMLAILPRRPDDYKLGGLLVREQIKLHRYQKELDQKLATMQGTLERAVDAAKHWKNRIDEQEPLFQIGVAVRVGFLESVKRTWRNGSMCVIRGDPDAEIIKLKNNAVHRGDFAADRALFELGILKISKQGPDFTYVYGLPGKCLPPTSVELRLLNMRGTMIGCYYKTKYTIDMAKDREFETLEKTIKTRMEALKEVKLIEADSYIKQNLEAMSKIVETTSFKERERINGRREG